MEGRVSGNRTFGRGWSRQDCTEDGPWGRPALGRAGWTASVPSRPVPLADWPRSGQKWPFVKTPRIYPEALRCQLKRHRVQCFRAEVFKVSSKITHPGRSGSRRGPAGGTVRLITGSEGGVLSCSCWSVGRGVRGRGVRETLPSVNPQLVWLRAPCFIFTAQTHLLLQFLLFTMHLFIHPLVHQVVRQPVSPASRWALRRLTVWTGTHVNQHELAMGLWVQVKRQKPTCTPDVFRA